MTPDQIDELILIRDKLEMLGDAALDANDIHNHDKIGLAFHAIAAVVGYPDPDQDTDN